MFSVLDSELRENTVRYPVAAEYRSAAS